MALTDGWMFGRGLVPATRKARPVRRPVSRIGRPGAFTAARQVIGRRALPGVVSPSQTFVDPNTGEIWSEADRRVRERVNPILALLERRQAEEEATARATTEQINVNTDAAYAKAREPLANVYNQGIQQATSIEEAIAKNLRGEGAQAGSELAAKLAAINAPDAAASTQDLAQTYQGAGGAEYAKGMSSVQSLVGRAAEAKAWLEKQPGLARQQTAQDLMEALTEIAKGYREEREDITAGIPGQIQDLYETLFGQKTEESRYQREQSRLSADTAEERRRYGLERKDKLRQERNAERAARQEAKDRAVAIALARGDKKEAKRLDMEYKMWAKQYDRQTKILTQREPGVQDPGTGERYILDQNGNPVALNPNYVPPTKPKPKDGTVNDTYRTPGSKKQERVWQTAMNSVWNPAGHFKQDVINVAKTNPGGLDGYIIRKIDASLRGQGVTNIRDIRRLRNLILSRLNGKRIAGTVYDSPYHN